MIDAITKAMRANDVETMLSHCAPDIVTFDMLPPLKHEGADDSLHLGQRAGRGRHCRMAANRRGIYPLRL